MKYEHDALYVFLGLSHSAREVVKLGSAKEVMQKQVQSDSLKFGGKTCVVPLCKHAPSGYTAW